MTDRDDRMTGDDADVVGVIVEDEPEVEALVVDIAATRSEMADTVDELGERLAPSAVAERAGDAVREATVGRLESKVNDVTTTASDFVSSASETVQQTGGGIVETIRRNPVPAALAGIGIGWLVINRGQGEMRSTSWRANRRPLRSGWEAADDGWRRTDRGPLDDVGDTIERRARGASAALDDATSDARQAIGETVDELGSRASLARDTVGTTATDAITQAQQAVESNPLAFGALAVAVGTAIGLALPATSAEKRMMGGAGGRLIDQVETAVSEPLDEMARRGGGSQSSGTASGSRTTAAGTAAAGGRSTASGEGSSSMSSGSSPTSSSTTSGSSGGASGGSSSTAGSARSGRSNRSSGSSGTGTTVGD
jgi:ElaB/YqjD/DUF883 family membrane-anchored ribosome-binding protein